MSSLASSSFVAVIWPLSNSSIDGKLDIFDETTDENTQRIDFWEEISNSTALFLRRFQNVIFVNKFYYLCEQLLEIEFSLEQPFDFGTLNMGESGRRIRRRFSGK